MTRQIPAVVRGSTALATGALTRSALRSRSWQRVVRGVYTPAATQLTHELRCRAVGAFLLPANGAIAGRSAATLLGVGLSNVWDPVEIIVPAAARPRLRDVAAHSGPLDPADVRTIGDVPVTTAVRTSWDLARWLPTTEAVVLIDRLLHRDLVTPAELAEYAADRAGRHGIRRFEQVIPLVDGRAESPQESRLRVALRLAGLPAPDVQRAVYDSDGFIGRVDLAYPELRIAIEYDGQWHSDANQLHRDRQRLNRLQAAGWLVLHVTSARLRDDLDGLIREITQAISSRRRARRP